MLQFYSGLDATDAYNAFHYNKKPEKYLKNLPVVPLQTPAPTGALPPPLSQAAPLAAPRRLDPQRPAASDPDAWPTPPGKEASLLSDFRALHESWEARGFFKPTLAFWVPWCVAVLGAVLAGARLGGVAGGLLMGVAWAHCGFVQHHAGHMGMIRTQILFECLVKGGSARWWRNRHTKHHACPNVLGKDGDLRTTPFLAWDGVLARKVPSPLLRVQHVAFLPLLIAYVPIFFLTTKKYLLHAASRRGGAPAAAAGPG